MKYKLLGFENLGQTKERYFKQGLRQRLKLISNIKSKQAIKLDVDEVDIKFKRCLPIDKELLAQISQSTENLLSWETRVKEYDSEIDVKEEKERLDSEKEENIQREQKTFGSYYFKNGDDKNVQDFKNDKTDIKQSKEVKK